MAEHINIHRTTAMYIPHTPAHVTPTRVPPRRASRPSRTNKSPRVSRDHEARVKAARVKAVKVEASGIVLGAKLRQPRRTKTVGARSAAAAPKMSALRAEIAVGIDSRLELPYSARRCTWRGG